MAQDQSTFNADAYLAANPDVASSGLDPWYHYSTWGQNEGRQAIFAPEPEAEKDSRYFNEDAYLAANPDVAAAIGQPGVESAYQHYINFGKNEGRQASFDVSETTARANELSEKIYEKYKSNLNHDSEYRELQALKDVDPEAYYKAQIKFLGQQVGWQIGQNTSERNGPAIQRIQELTNEALNAGLNPNTLNSILNTSVNTANIQNQQRIINEQQSGGGGFNLGETLRGIAPVAALAIGGPLLEAAMAASAAASAGAGAGALETAGAAGLSGGGAFVPAAGSGASFVLPGYTSTAALMGPTYGELGITGVEGGFAGPTYAEMGYTGLNQSQAIAAADAASKGMSLADALSYANRARQGLGIANKLINSQTGQSGSSFNPQQLASALNLNAPAKTNDFIGQIKGNVNPYLFTTPGQTTASEGMYDVSGSNMANALRKA